MLTSSLRELEKEGFIHGEVYAMVPPKVEYSLTERDRRAIPIITRVLEYGFELMKEFGIDASNEDPNNA
jgi:DNA-binding HxlR family transcriptional regulator